MTLKHTEFMQTIARTVANHLEAPYRNFRTGETRWFCQIYFGQDKRIHYEVSRPSNLLGRVIEVGLHFESRDKALNRHLLERFDLHLIELCNQLQQDVKAEQWDRGWTKLYVLYPDEELTPELADLTAKRLAEFVMTVEPIYKHQIRDKN